MIDKKVILIALVAISLLIIVVSDPLTPNWVKSMDPVTRAEYEKAIAEYKDIYGIQSVWLNYTDPYPDYPDPSMSYVLDPLSMTQGESVSPGYDTGGGVCRLTAMGMLMKWCDDNYGTNYFGDPYDNDLNIYFHENVEDTLKDQYEAQYNINVWNHPLWQIDVWAWYRDEPRIDTTHFYEEDCSYGSYCMGPDNFPDQFVYDECNHCTTFTYDNIKPLFNLYNMPAYVVVSGASSSGGARHAICSWGWSEDLFGEYRDYPHIMMFDTWTHNNNTCIEIAKYDEGDFWDIEEMIFFTVTDEPPDPDPDDGDMNGNGEVNSADVRYLAMHLVGAPGYSILHSNGDTNSNGDMNSADVRYLAMYLVGHQDYQPLYP